MHICSHQRGYSSQRDWKRSVHVQNKEVFTIERCISSKNRSVGPESVQNNEVFTIEGCSLIEVLLYIYIKGKTERQVFSIEKRQSSISKINKTKVYLRLYLIYTICLSSVNSIHRIVQIFITYFAHLFDCYSSYYFEKLIQYK